MYKYIHKLTLRHQSSALLRALIIPSFSRAEFVFIRCDGGRKAAKPSVALQVYFGLDLGFRCMVACHTK